MNDRGRGGKAEDDANAMRLPADAEVSDDIAGFHAQQAVEKWLKAVLGSRGIEFEYTHDLGWDQTEVSSKHQVTIPAGAFRTAGFAPGDTLRVEVEGAGRVVLTRIDEVLTGARLGHYNQEGVAGFFRGLLSAVLPVDVPVADRAADLRSRFNSLRMPDALIATAETDSDVDLVVTGDEQLAKVSGLGVKVRLLR